MNTKDFWVEMSIREISTQAHFAELAYSNINVSDDIKTTDVVFSAIHSFLSHCSMVSKMLKSRDDSDPTKNIGTHVLGVDMESIIHNRAFRNSLEHYDDRLKKWIKLYPDSSIGINNIAPKSAIPGIVFISNYDPTNNVFTFVNEDFALTPLKSEVSRIKVLANLWLENLTQEKLSHPLI